MTKNSARPPTTALAASPCPCGLGESYRDCCGRFHSGRATAPTAERLMRSRFSAFAVRDAAYLLRTWHSTTRPSDIGFDPDQRWTRLEIIGTADGSPFHTEGTVEFRARFSLHGQADSQHELSRFVREDGLWVYLGEATA
ncbi:YchJ family metal-binding protein [Streptomyces sp. H10-C2]|uniref:YchJ family protein n=1 Tax=unclassified Streptomyces TaxID=2593676 RepID=UPI0024B8EDD0|nr:MULTISPECIES: YchJ family metal-binding protein [unclassified Streptomyces]MDJ0343569.1 YchJ family metal-binding protein [Streptomyces sp. PH10-H1]MDJ0368855.1 YchJ family metal-binding protein [Streptomyces sp. H10-C2]